MSNKLIKFGSDYCGPCKIVDNVLDNLDTEIEIIKYDISEDDGMEEGQKMGIKSIPTLFLVSESGEVLQSHTGVISKEEIMAWVLG
tara:strand:+ start:5804 stop:6061 length:258 start_codon:yes stop_codon:yes gene_type:complete